MTTKPKTRKAPVKPAASKPDPLGMEFDADGLSQAIVEAEDILGVARKLTGATYIMATDLNEYECGAICEVTSGPVPQKSGQGRAPSSNPVNCCPGWRSPSRDGRALAGRLRCDTAKTGVRFPLGAPFAYWKIQADRAKTLTERIPSAPESS
jgi:hypothetical protein